MKSPSPSSSQHGIVFTPPSTFHSSSPFSPSVSGSEEPAAPPPPEVQAEPSIYRVRTSWTPAVAGPIAVVGRQEPPLEEGVLSGNHSHHQRHSPDHNHLITEHRHLSPLIKSTISTHSSQAVTVWSQHCMLNLPDPLTFVCILVVPVQCWVSYFQKVINYSY